jgi:hypothetical protein
MYDSISEARVFLFCQLPPKTKQQVKQDTIQRASASLSFRAAWKRWTPFRTPFIFARQRKTRKRWRLCRGRIWRPLGEVKESFSATQWASSLSASSWRPRRLLMASRQRGFSRSRPRKICRCRRTQVSLPKIDTFLALSCCYGESGGDVHKKQRKYICGNTDLDKRPVTQTSSWNLRFWCFFSYTWSDRRLFAQSSFVEIQITRRQNVTVRSIDPKI